MCGRISLEMANSLKLYGHPHQSDGGHAIYEVGIPIPIVVVICAGVSNSGLGGAGVAIAAIC